MNLSKLMLVCAVALSGFAVGCKSDCESACDDRKDCPGGDSETDCSKTCSAEEDAADNFGCKHQLEDLSSCIADVDDVCKLDLTKQCTQQNDALNTCYAQYCAAHRDAYGCESSATP
jgi:hypothetical protein